MTHAIVLIEAERSAIETLGGALADVDGVAEAYSVTGEWDFVAMLRVRDPAEVIPCHYNTFPPIEADAEAFKSDVQNAGFSQVTVLEPGGTHTVR